ncbi:protein SGT1 homolog [Artemia franciscana]|uniref:Suppressor of G2 allele of SKP1 n=1 Tax=Artemia franciscana TaxID=6661 RepID=A0AA88HKG2_ARTSF|nr:hypothetical protein QYM36_014898 [Artemia franciscana]KAK2707027.1 hypothetical protein QYM36_014898 [Artemia franciscana]
MASTCIRHDFYQTDAFVVITLMVKNKSDADFEAEFQTDFVRTTIKNEDGSEIEFSVVPCHPIKPEQCSFKVTKTKIEVKLKKAEGIHWNTLERKEESAVKPAVIMKSSDISVEEQPAYPTSSKKKVDWSRVEAEADKEEEEGEAAIEKLFQKIYKDNPDDVKRAMMKSFAESGGTVLSTNWADVQKGKVEVKPPDGMEFRKWEQ